MGQTAQEILREALLNQMEKEASEVPSTEQIRQMHKFSDRFLKYMEQLKEQEEEKQKKKRVPFSGWKNFAGKKPVMRIAAACIVCVIAVGSGWWGLRTFFSGDGGSTANMQAADTAQSQSAETMPEEAMDDSGESGAGAYDNSGESGTGAYDNSGESGTDTYGDLGESGVDAYGDSSGMRITAEEISMVEVTGNVNERDNAQDKNSSYLEIARDLYANKEQTQELVTILNSAALVNSGSVEDADDLPLAEFLITKTDESVLNISVYDSKIVIDGVRYEAEAEICEQLRALAENIGKTSGEE